MGVFLDRSHQPLQPRQPPAAVLEEAEKRGVRLANYAEASQLYVQAKCLRGIEAMPATIQGFVVTSKKAEEDPK